MPWWIPLAGAAVGAISGGHAARKQADRQRRLASDLSRVTPNEREYMKRQRAIAEGGDPFQNQLMAEQMNRVVGNIRQTGAENLQRTEGSIIGQGMENSIVAAELRRKTSKDTMRSIAEQSRRITAENRFAREQTKRAAEERLYQTQSGIDQRGFQAMGIRAGIKSRSEINMGALTSIAQAGLGAYGDYLESQENKKKKKIIPIDPN